MLMATLTGTLFLYQGQEIGMTNIPHAWPPEMYEDVRSVNYYNEAKVRYKDDPEEMKAAIKKMWKRARDHARLPMQWDDGENAGFCAPGVDPWMMVHEDSEENNVQTQLEDPDSLLWFWKELLEMRKEYKDLFVYGHYQEVDTRDDNLFVFMKEGGGMRSYTVLNMSGKRRTWRGASTLLSKYKLLIGNMESLERNSLRAWEARVYIRML
jgi:oligo-1,6-glucosidase